MINTNKILSEFINDSYTYECNIELRYINNLYSIEISIKEFLYEIYNIYIVDHNNHLKFLEVSNGTVDLYNYIFNNNYSYLFMDEYIKSIIKEDDDDEFYVCLYLQGKISKVQFKKIMDYYISKFINKIYDDNEFSINNKALFKMFIRDKLLGEIYDLNDYFKFLLSHI